MEGHGINLLCARGLCPLSLQGQIIKSIWTFQFNLPDSQAIWLSEIRAVGGVCRHHVGGGGGRGGGNGMGGSIPVWNGISATIPVRWHLAQLDFPLSARLWRQRPQIYRMPRQPGSYLLTQDIAFSSLTATSQSLKAMKAYLGVTNHDPPTSFCGPLRSVIKRCIPGLWSPSERVPGGFRQRKYLSGAVGPVRQGKQSSSARSARIAAATLHSKSRYWQSTLYSC